MSEQRQIEEHYHRDGLVERIEEALRTSGLGSGRIEPAQLARLDQFHAGGLAATRALAEGLDLRGGERVLDVGSGLGGPARFLAATYGCEVTGIDLSPSYTEVAAMLGRRTKLSERLTFVQGNALELPFESERFDHAWTLHVAMNIADKASLYRGIHRVLKRGGRFAIYDVVLGNGEPVLYPSPWASDASTSFLVRATEIVERLSEAGFEIVSSVDPTDAVVASFGLSPEAPFPLDLTLLIGPNAESAAPNMMRNLVEGRTRLAQIVAQKI